jgi:PIN domain
VIRATVDTNAIASGFLRGDTPPGRILAAWRARLFILVISAFILDELDRTLATPYFTRHLSSEQRAANVILLRDQAVITPITVTVSARAARTAPRPSDGSSAASVPDRDVLDQLRYIRHDRCCRMGRPATRQSAIWRRPFPCPRLTLALSSSTSRCRPVAGRKSSSVAK